MAYLLDTGILLRLFDRSDQQYLPVQAAIRRLLRRDERLVTASQNLAEFWNVSTRPFSARGGYGFSVTRVAQRVHAVERICDVVTESPESHERWKRLLTDFDLVGVAVHDARLVAIMNVYGIDRILTLDPAGFRRYGSLNVLSPVDLA